MDKETKVVEQEVVEVKEVSEVEVERQNLKTLGLLMLLALTSEREK